MFWAEPFLLYDAASTANLKQTSMT